MVRAGKRASTTVVVAGLVLAGISLVTGGIELSALARLNLAGGKKNTRTRVAAMHHELIGYLLGALDHEELTLVEEYLAAQPDAARYLEILRHGLEPLEADRGHLNPPTGLALRTCRVVRIRIQSNQMPSS